MTEDTRTKLWKKSEYKWSENNQEHCNLANAYLTGAHDVLEEMWHTASEEPKDRAHCLIRFDFKNMPTSYLDFEPVLYNKEEKKFVTEVYPHPTGYKVEQHSFEGGTVAEVHKNRRDYIPLTDVYSWAYLEDLLS